MYLINDDNTLRAFAPNVLATVQGEPTLFEKVEPFLQQAEQWLIDNVTGDILDELESLALRWAKTATAHCAMADALPALDVVLTPNGFGVVNNNNVAPASKERTQALVASYRLSAMVAVSKLIRALASYSSWIDSEPYNWLTESVFQAPNDCVLFSMDISWENFTMLRNKVAPVEYEMAASHISHELMKRLRQEQAQHKLSQPDRYLMMLIRANVVRNQNARRSEHGTRLLLQQMDDITDYIRNNAELYPEWHESPVATLFDPPVFKNEQSDGGYFF